MGCFPSKEITEEPEFGDPAILASETPFTVTEVGALHELYKKLSSSVIDDGYIQKEELLLALFKNSNKRSLFADRKETIYATITCRRKYVPDFFVKNGHIEFGEFVQTLSIFHPRTPESEKIAHAFKLYDLRHTGYIEREELKEMVLALLNESDLNLSDDIVETIIDKTFKDADINGDGRIDQDEWKEFASKNPNLLRNMTLPYLMDISLAFPSFVLRDEAKGCEAEGLHEREYTT